MREPKVFLSYERHELDFVRELATHLAAGGLDVWWDQELTTNAKWSADIEQRVVESDWLVFVLTPEAAVSPRARLEVECFTGKRQWDRVVVLQREAAPVPEAWAALKQFTPVREVAEYQAAVPRVVQDLGGDPGRLAKLGPLDPGGQGVARLPAELREKVIALLADLCAENHWGVAGALELPAAFRRRSEQGIEWHDQFRTARERANAALVLPYRDLDVFAAAETAMKRLGKTLVPAGHAKRADLDSLLTDLETAQAGVVAADPLQPYRDHVQAETERLLHESLRVRGDATDGHGPRALEEVYVELSVAGDGRKGWPVEPQLAAMAAALAEPGGGVDVPLRLWMPSAAIPVHYLGEMVECLEARGLHVALDQIVLGNPTFTVGIRRRGRTGGVPDHQDPELQAAERAGRLVFVLFVAPEMSADAEASVVAFIDSRREQWPGARVVLIEAATSISLEGLLRLDLSLHPHLTGRYVVRGAAGTGKTTLLRRTARRLAQASDLVPVLASLPRLAEHGRSLADELKKRCQGILDPTLLLARFQRGGEGLLLLLDGLDEVASSDQREWAEDFLQGLPGQLPHARIVVATRGIPYRQFAPTAFRELDVQPLGPDQQERLLANWFRSGGRVADPDARAREGMAWLDQRQRAFAEIRTVPLMLTFVAMLFETEQEPAGNRSDLYQQILGCLMAGRHKKDPPRLSAPEGSRRALQLLAHALTEHEQGELQFAALQTSMLTHWRDPGLADVRVCFGDLDTPSPPRHAEFLLELARVTDIVFGRDDPQAPWRFWHRSLREALVAEDLAAQADAAAGRKALLAQAGAVRGKEAQWAEPFALCVGMVEDPDDLLLALNGANPDLALRALGGVEKLDRVDTAVQILCGGQADLGAVRREIDRLADKVGAEAAVPVLGRLAEGTDDTQTLWHVDEALAACLRAEPGLRDEVARVRQQQLFAHSSFGPRIDPESLVVPGQEELGGYWCRVPAGTRFWMGSKDNEQGRVDRERPRHEVEIAQTFELAAVPVTNAEYWRFRTRHEFPAGRDHHPVVEVDWYDATMYSRWLGARLPSEAEWECACRAGTETRFWSGDKYKDLARVGWYDANSKGSTHPVAQKAANPLGLYDMHGNVWEWCDDRWHGDYEGAPADGSPWLGGGSVLRVVRGGSGGDTAGRCRSAFRGGHPAARNVHLGFRPARFVRP